MKLKNIEFTYFRCFDSLLVNLDEKLTVFIAPNGEGKTALLDGIAIGLGGFLQQLPNVSSINFKKTDLQIDPKGKERPYEEIRVELSNGISWDRRVVRDKSQKTRKNLPGRLGFKLLKEFANNLINKENESRPYSLPIIAYYGIGRGIFESPKKGKYFKKDFARFEAFRNSLESKANFSHLFDYFFFLEDLERREKIDRGDIEYTQPEMDAIRTSIEGMMPNFSNPRTKMRPFRFLIDWKKKNTAPTLRINQLSDGYRTTLAMVMDIASRMAEANPNSKNILETEGIVLIDEIDLHLHPGWQQSILGDLIKTFPKIQFIVSTHSPQVISTVPASNIRILQDGKIYSSPPGTKGAESSRILKRVFGIDPRPPHDPNTILLNDYLQLVYGDQWDSPEARKIRHKLDEIYRGEEPALTEADLYIENRKWELVDEAD
jgi:predicted ATP-binding protein involved in virulence